jgi:hypothetical protein
VFCVILGLSSGIAAQNVGIGTSTPAHPLSFPNTIGSKISLYGGAGNHYGLGIQGGLLQVYSDAAGSNIAFGYGSSASFNERMRIVNSGGTGLLVGGRMVMSNGTSPLDPAYGPGIWMYKADNSGLLGFMGVQNNQNLGFYGGPAGWGFTYDAINSRIGIGNNNPNAPLAFPPVLGKKITLYPGASGDVGFGVAGNRLQIYADNPNADVAIGYDAAGVFNERFAVKPNGALAASGNTGAPLQVLSSNGSGAGAQWRGMYDMLGRNIMQPYYEGGSLFLLNDETVQNSTPFQFSLATPSAVLLWSPVRLRKTCAIYPCFSSVRVKVFVDAVERADWTYSGVSLLYNGNATDDHNTAGPIVFDLAAGAHTLTYTVQSQQGAVSCNVKPQVFIVSK